MDGALLIDKPKGLSSFGVIESLQRAVRDRAAATGAGTKRRELPKLGHGGTLDPFATGLLAVCTGRALKLARYFLGSAKTYSGVMRFGETTVPGDPTAPVSETSARLPGSLEELGGMAARFAAQPYLQTPPMHSAKKKNGKPLYALAREGIEVEREAKVCELSNFEFSAYAPPRAEFRVTCTSGTYVRTLAQDFARLLGTVGMLDELRREAAGGFHAGRSMRLADAEAEIRAGARLDELECWVPFDRLLEGYGRADATEEERRSLYQGRQDVLFNILKRMEPPGSPEKAGPSVAIYCRSQLIAVARAQQGEWGLERVFIRE